MSTGHVAGRLEVGGKKSLSGKSAVDACAPVQTTQGEGNYTKASGFRF